MKNSIFKHFAVALCGAGVFTSGCENLSSTEAGLIAAGLAGSATGIALGTTGVPAASTIPISLGAAAGAGTLALVGTKMQTSRDQRSFSESRGRSLVDAARKKGVNVPQFILVDTLSTSAGSGRAVMMYDTFSGRVTNNRVYYVSLPPGPYGFNEAPAGFGRW